MLGDELRVADVLRHQARERRGRVAIKHGSRSLTFAELDERSSRLAQALLAAGVGPGSRVAHLDRTAPEVVELLFAAAKIGAVAVPLNWRLHPTELAAILQDAGAPLLLAGPAYTAVAVELAGAVAHDLRVVAIGAEYERWLASHPADDPGGRGDRTTPCCRCTRRGPPACPRVCSRRIATSRPPWTPRRCGASTRTRSASRPFPCSTSGASAGRSSASGTVPDHPRQRVRRRGGPGSPRRRARHQRGLRADHPADAVRGPGVGGPRLLRAAIDRLRGVADHHPGAQGGAANLRMRAVRRLWAHRDDRRRGAARSRRPRPRRAA